MIKSLRLEKDSKREGNIINNVINLSRQKNK